jgi:hypothetical protein
MAGDSTTTERDPLAHDPRALAFKRIALVSLAVLVLVFLVAVGSSRSLVRIGGPGDLSHTRHVTGSVVVILFAIAVALATVYVAWELLREYSDEESGPGERQSTWRRLLAQMAVIAMIAIVVFALAIAKPGRSRLRPRPSEQTRPGVISHLNGKSISEQTAADLAPWIIGGVLILLVLLMVAAFILRRRRVSALVNEPLGDELEVRRSELREAIEGSLEEIESEPDSRRAVIRAYAGMENALAQHGLGRRRFEAPHEYLIRAFAAVQMSRSAGERLTRLFERARFSEHQIGPEMKREALAALTEVRNELAVDSE